MAAIVFETTKQMNCSRVCFHGEIGNNKPHGAFIKKKFHMFACTTCIFTLIDLIATPPQLPFVSSFARLLQENEMKLDVRCSM